jgi:hypothetical protein
MPNEAQQRIPQPEVAPLAGAYPTSVGYGCSRIQIVRSLPRGFGAAICKHLADHPDFFRVCVPSQRSRGSDSENFRVTHVKMVYLATQFVSLLALFSAATACEGASCRTRPAPTKDTDLLASKALANLDRYQKATNPHGSCTVANAARRREWFGFPLSLPSSLT